jgi:TRAP-type uncharacterized transport system fused permease subunit
MMITWKYTLPAFLVPFAFTLSSDGLGILLQGSPIAIAAASITAAMGVAAIAIAIGGWLRLAATAVERVAFGASGLLLIFATGITEVVGFALLAAVIGVHLLRARRLPAPPSAHRAGPQVR